MSVDGNREANKKLVRQVNQPKKKTFVEQGTGERGYRSIRDGGYGRVYPLLESTRELTVDWERWEEHVFFGSAQAKVNSTAEWIRTSYPFDGTLEDVQKWRRGLNGWQDWMLRERWVNHLYSASFDVSEGDVNCQMTAIQPGSDGQGVPLITFGGQNLSAVICDSIAPTTDQEKPSEIPAIYTLDLEAMRANRGRRAQSSDEISISKLNPRSNGFTVEFWLRIDPDAMFDPGSFWFSNSANNPPTPSSGATPMMALIPSAIGLPIGWRPISTHRNLDGEGWTTLVKIQQDGSLKFGAHLSKRMNLQDHVHDGPAYSQSYGDTKAEFSPHDWHHVAFSWSSAPEGRDLTIIVNGATQTLDRSFNSIKGSDGLWSTHALDPHWIGWAPNPQVSESGGHSPNFPYGGFGGFLVDDYRIWSERIADEEIDRRRIYTQWKQENLSLQYRFNDSPETSLMIAGSSAYVALDSSGNRLHGQRDLGDGPSTSALLGLSQERPDELLESPRLHPGIFPLDTQQNAILDALRASGKKYDIANPNLISKLVPPHLFKGETLLSPDDLQDYDQRAQSEEGALILAALLYTWAEFWDDLKIRGDALTSSLRLNPDGSGAAGGLLPIIAKEMGVSLPLLFQDIKSNHWDDSFDKIQEDVWRRTLLALPDAIKKRGTLEGVKTLFNAIGTAGVNEAVRFREWGGDVTTTSRSFRTFTQKMRFVKSSGGSAFATYKIKDIKR